jgi:hypothetical protein
MGILMTLRQWSSSNLHYGWKLLDSGLEGARSGEQAFLGGARLSPVLNRSVRIALAPAALGVCLGFFGSHPGSRRRSAARAFTCGVLGGVVGFGAGVAWDNRRLASSIASSAMKNIGRVRDEHWLDRHPIDYA